MESRPASTGRYRESGATGLFLRQRIPPGQNPLKGFAGEAIPQTLRTTMILS